MDINEYIASGTLELYAAGALTPDEEREVEIMAAKYPEVRSELDEIEHTLEHLAVAEGVRPATHLRQSILTSIALLEEAAPEHPSTQPGSPSSSASLRPSHRAIPPAAIPLSVPAPPPPSSGRPAAIVRLPSRFRYMIAASMTVAVLSSGLAAYFGYQWNRAEKDLASMTLERTSIAHERGVIKARLDAGAIAMQELSDPRNRMVMLKGKDISPSAFARVYWNPETRHVRFDPRGLPTPPPGKQYQLWAIASGAPVDAGLVDISTEWPAAMKNIQDAQAFAVTLEPAGGSAVPTLTAMYVAGNV